jgi:hypothetical protein
VSNPLVFKTLESTSGRCGKPLNLETLPVRVRWRSSVNEKRLTESSFLTFTAQRH